MPARSVVRSRPAHRRRASRAALLVLSLLAGCAGGSAAGFGGVAPGPTAPSTPESTVGSTDDGDGAADPLPAPVELADLPAGFEVVQRAGIGLAFAVPEPWSPIAVGGDVLTDGIEDLSASDPAIADLLAGAGGMFGDVVGMGAAGTARGGRPGGAVAVQLELSLPSIPEMMVDQMERQLEANGATDVVAERVDVAGLEDGARGLSVSATIRRDGASQPVQMLMVPTSEGLAFLSVYADPATAAAIIATVTAG